MNSKFANNPNLRPGTRVVPHGLNLVYNCEGLGGYIQWTTAMQWVYEVNPNLYGKVFCTQIFFDLAKLWFSHLSDRVKVIKTGRVLEKDLVQVYGPRFIFPSQLQLHTALGANPLRLGFNYFADLDYIPAGYHKLPRINGSEVKIRQFNLPKSYVVVTTEATTKSRMLKAETINGMTDWLISKNITPVFLGKKELAAEMNLEHKYEASSPEGLNTNGVLDLRNKTDLLQAACVLANAKVVVGLDNGLLHLAACSDVPIVWGFNTVNPIHRIPPRDGPMIAVVPSEKLQCRFCQSHTRYVVEGHDFRNCYYDDFKCIDMLTADAFTKSIAQVLDEPGATSER